MNKRAFILMIWIGLGLALTTNSQAEEPDRDGVHAVLEVQGMSTTLCPVLVRKSVSKLEGVDQIEVSLKTGLAEIDYDPARITLAQIQDVIQDQTGFTTRIRP